MTRQPVECPESRRVDGPKHTWKFDGDDPRIFCVWCGETRDALTNNLLPWKTHGGTVSSRRTPTGDGGAG